ncbi:MAG: radical SAM protein [Oscillospiraceae bacterium]|nr:radical SAM protein [Oscillospiraceae bacterium]
MHLVDAKGLLSGGKGYFGMNIYRGCTHGCIYCDSRSACYGFTHPFEDVEVKRNAPELLEAALRSKRRRCMIGTGSMSDPYMHCEEQLGLTRRCLEIIRRYGFGVSILTKSDRILRDIDLLDAINRESKCVVQMTLTTFDDALCSIVEPNVCPTSRRLKVLEEMRRRGIPTFVWLTPVLPWINDTRENVEAILNACVRAGVRGVVCFDMGLTLREGDREYYYAALDRHFPGLKEKYIRRYGTAYELPSPNRAELMASLRRICGENGLLYRPEDCFAWIGEFPEKQEQVSLFDG